MIVLATRITKNHYLDCFCHLKVVLFKPQVKWTMFNET